MLISGFCPPPPFIHVSLVMFFKSVKCLRLVLCCISMMDHTSSTVWSVNSSRSLSTSHLRLPSCRRALRRGSFNTIFLLVTRRLYCAETVLARASSCTTCGSFRIVDILGSQNTNVFLVLTLIPLPFVYPVTNTSGVMGTSGDEERWRIRTGATCRRDGSGSSLVAQASSELAGWFTRSLVEGLGRSPCVEEHTWHTGE